MYSAAFVDRPWNVHIVEHRDAHREHGQVVWAALRLRVPERAAVAEEIIEKVAGFRP